MLWDYTAHPDPGFDYYFKACRKGDATAKAVTLGDSAVRVLADASEITGLPRGSEESDLREVLAKLGARRSAHSLSRS